MYHKPMTYVYRAYCMAHEPMEYVVYFCSRDGKKTYTVFDNSKKAKAFMTALDGLGFTKKRR